MAERARRYRVLWIDAAGEGRFLTVSAMSLAEAVWQVAIAADSSQARYEDVQPMGDDDA